MRGHWPRSIIDAFHVIVRIGHLSTSAPFHSLMHILLHLLLVHDTLPIFTVIVNVAVNVAVTNALTVHTLMTKVAVLALCFCQTVFTRSQTPFLGAEVPCRTVLVGDGTATFSLQNAIVDTSQHYKQTNKPLHKHIHNQTLDSLTFCCNFLGCFPLHSFLPHISGYLDNQSQWSIS